MSSSNQDLILPPQRAAVPQRTAVAQSSAPADLLRLAVEQGADIDRLERLMALQQQWEAAQAKRQFDEAFAAFKAEGVQIIKNKRISDGPMKGKTYADLFAVVEVVTPVLSKHGLGSSWKLTKDEKDWLEVTCFLKHYGGHTESVSMGGPPDSSGAKNPIQARASTVAYLERYTALAILGMAAQEQDKDGNVEKTGGYDTTEWERKITSAADLDKLAEVRDALRSVEMPEDAVKRIKKLYADRQRELAGAR
jgi:hypothetical protein